MHNISIEVLLNGSFTRYSIMFTYPPENPICHQLRQFDVWSSMVDTPSMHHWDDFESIHPDIEFWIMQADQHTKFVQI